MGGVIAGVVAVVMVILILLLVMFIAKRKGHSKYELNKTSKIEMGSSGPSKPILGGKEICSVSNEPKLPMKAVRM